MISIEEYRTYYQDSDQKYRSGFGIEKAKGWHIINRATAKFAGGTYTTEEEAQAALVATVERINAAQTPAAPTEAPDYRTKRDSFYGEGRVYRTQPGATEYDDGSGRYGIQIWDEA